MPATRNSAGPMRVLRTAEDTAQSTSFETYLRGELGTYSERTMALYRRFVDDLLRKGRNLTEETIAHTVALAGFADLAEAEAAQADAGIGALPAGPPASTGRYVTRHGAFARCALSLPETR